MSCHDYEGVMLVLCTPLQVKCFQIISEYRTQTVIWSHSIQFAKTLQNKSSESMCTYRGPGKRRPTAIRQQSGSS